MEPFFSYIIKSSLCLVLFYLFYKTLLSKETFFRFNRFVLMGGIIICSILPLVTFQTEKELLIQTPIRKMESLLSDTPLPNFPIVWDETDYNDGSHPLVTDYQNHSNEQPYQIHLSKNQIISLIYFIGLLITLTGLSVSVYRMIQLIRKGKKVHSQDYILILTKQKICPFSFGKYIVISEADYIQNPKEILTHEQVHAKKMHSLDLLFSEFFILLHWFNPVVWLLKRELQDVHEYEADNGVINLGIDATQYQLLLVKKAVGARSYAIANSFNHSKIKNRITMMLKKKSTQWARLKLLLFIPLAAAALQAFARPEKVQANESSLSIDKGTTIFSEKDLLPPPPPPRLVTAGDKENDSISGKSYQKEVKYKKGKDAPPPPTLRIVKDDEVPMTEQEKVATKEFEAAAEKYASVMKKYAANIEKQVQSKEMVSSKEMEEAGKKLRSATKKWQEEMSKIPDSGFQTQNKEFEAAAQKYRKVMEKYKDEADAGIETPEMKAAKEEFKVASKKFKENLKQVRIKTKEWRDNPEIKAARADFKSAAKKYREENTKHRVVIKELRNDPAVKAAKEEFNLAREKYREAMKGYKERVKEKRQSDV